MRRSRHPVCRQKFSLWCSPHICVPCAILVKRVNHTGKFISDKRASGDNYRSPVLRRCINRLPLTHLVLLLSWHLTLHCSRRRFRFSPNRASSAARLNSTVRCLLAGLANAASESACNLGGGSQRPHPIPQQRQARLPSALVVVRAQAHPIERYFHPSAQFRLVATCSNPRSGAGRT